MRTRYSFLFIPLLLAVPELTLDAQEAPNSWSIVASYTIPGKASGLAWDGTYIYFGIYGSNGDQVYKFNTTSGQATLQCTGPFNDAFGLTYKSPDLVTISQPSSSSNPASILEFTLAGSQVSTLTLPDHYMSGVAWDNGTWWVCTYYPDPGTVYHLNSSGGIISQFTPPNNQPWDICLQGSDLWIADYYGNTLYKVDASGNLLDSHASQGIKPSGIVYDGTYLWYCDGELGGNSTLYKVDLQGSGTPVIYLPENSHDYGTVTIGNPSTWNCQVQNTGTANLVINSIGIPTGQPISTTFTTPQTVLPGNSVNVPLTYTPVAAEPLNTQVSINSNDPINPTVEVTLTGNGVYNGPHISLAATSHDWGTRRAGAYSRWYLMLTNDGSTTLSITNLEMSDPHFIPDQGIQLPLNVQPLETANLGIWFHPEEGIPYNGTLTISSNAVGQETLDVALSGAGIDTVYPMGTQLWSYMITGGSDDSPKAIGPVQDITGDGVDDVIVCSEDDFIRCFNGNASITGDVLWSTFIYAGAVYDQNSLSTIDDIDGDGFRDVIVGTAWGDRSIIALSGKTGQQIWKHDSHEYGDGGWVYQVDARYDYNNDGFPDVLAATGNDGNGTGPVRVYCLNGKTGLSIWEYPVGGPVFSVIGTEDFTGDGKPDVVAGASNQNETAGKVIGLDGTNGSLKWTHPTTGTSVWGLLQVDDVNGDGKKDIASGDYSGKVELLNAVTGAQLKQVAIGNVLILRLQSMGDVNKDGHPDFLVAHSGTNGVMIDGYNGTVLWSKPLADKSWCVANIGDITFDGYNDAIIGTLYQSNYAYFLNGYDGDILDYVGTLTPVDALNAIPDIVGDSTMEMVIGGRNGAVVCLSGGYDTTVIIGVPGHMAGTGGMVIYPNPSRGGFTVRMDLGSDARVTFRLVSLTGRASAELRTESLSAGIHELGFRAPNGTPPGVYLLEARSGTFTWRQKVVLME
jgi:hypothetical protein